MEKMKDYKHPLYRLKVFNYLHDVREAGMVNMYCDVSAIKQFLIWEFPEIPKKISRQYYIDYLSGNYNTNTGGKK
jgi:hypothetical protein